MNHLPVATLSQPPVPLETGKKLSRNHQEHLRTQTVATLSPRSYNPCKPASLACRLQAALQAPSKKIPTFLVQLNFEIEVKILTLQTLHRLPKGDCTTRSVPATSATASLILEIFSTILFKQL